MTTFLDGTVIDLDRVQTAADRTEWLWTCEIGESGQPLMQRLDQPGQPGETLPLDYLTRWHGPLTPRPQATTAALYRQVLIGEAA
ncbi:phiSA1p31-related protein [Streptomyces rishiriensis]|uniref:phiSA1p31-related protein n=1 Tax=Streptomyces rishiriensis TaxID=68264 RepID=UPI000D5A0E27|nr:phiSA1p31-related protein [Streptomyces rishiriensis]